MSNFDYLTLKELDDGCPRCRSSVLFTYNTKTMEGSSVKAKIEAIQRDLICLDCGCRIRQVLSTGNTLPEPGGRGSPSRFGT